MDSKAVGNFIAELRKEQGLTQKQLAEKLSVTDKAVSRWETGKGYPDIETLTALSEVLGVSLNELIAGKRLDEEEIKTQSDKNIEEAYKRAKKAKRKKRFIIIISVLAAVALIVGAVIFINEVSYENKHNFKTEMLTDNPRAVMSELDALAQKNYNLSAYARYRRASLVVRNGEIEHFLGEFEDPMYSENFMSEAMKDFENRKTNLEFIICDYQNSDNRLINRLNNLFMPNSEKYEYTVTDGIPYKTFNEIIQTVDFEKLLGDNVGGEFEGYFVCGNVWNPVVYLPEEPEKEGEINTRRIDRDAPSFLYENGTLAKFDFNVSEETKYYLLEVGGLKGNLSVGTGKTVYIYVKGEEEETMIIYGK